MRTKKVRKSRQTFLSVGKAVRNVVGNRADGHMSDMHKPSVIPSVFYVGKAVGIRADEHVSDIRALRDMRQSVGDSICNCRRYSCRRTRVRHACASGCATIRRKSHRKSVGECGKIP
jgi:hypothetical protein